VFWLILGTRDKDRDGERVKIKEVIRNMQKTRLLEEELTHERIFEENYSWLMQWALRLTEGKHSEAEDLVHDLFIQLMRLRPSLHADPDHIRGYLYTMLRNMHLSTLRRARRSPICELSVVDYDSVEQGLRSIPDRPLSAVWMELLRICDYACERKKTSRSASVLILRFFLAYFPSEIARILKTTRIPVDKYLHAARREARFSVARPAALRIFGQKRTPRETPPVPEEPQECFLALRHQVFQSCEGKCFSKEALQRIYTSSTSESLSTSELAHLVSCPQCLDTLNWILGIRLLADRCPSKTLGREDGSPKDGGSGSGGGASSNNLERETLRRFEEENEHRPNYLQVAVNGDIKTSQKITSELSEFHVKLGRNRTLEFLEIFSEQNIRLLYLPISCSSRPTPSGEHASIQLSDGRTLEVSVSFSGDSPTIHVMYHDPLFAESEALAESVPFALFGADARTEQTLVGSPGLRRFCARMEARYSGIWPLGAMATSATSIFVVAALLLLHHAQPSQSPADLLQRACQRAAAEGAPKDLVRHTIRIQQLGVSGQTVREDSVEEWASGDAQNRARRLYDHDGALVAEQITRANHTKFYDKSRLGQIVQLNPAHLQLQDIWQITPSAKQFQELIAPDQPSAIQQVSDRYSIMYQRHANDGSGLVEATLVLRRKDLHPLEEDLVLRSDGEVHRVRLIESSYVRIAPSRVQKDVFAPDKELSEVESRNFSAERSPGATEPIEVSPERIIRALYLLSRVGADMNGETAVQSTAHGTLRITGTIATAVRRDEILRALSPLGAEGGVEIRLLTPDQLHIRNKGKQGRQAVEMVEPTEGMIPVDHQLRQFLMEHGTPPDQVEGAMQRYSRQVLANADQVQQHAWALDRIAKRFTPAELGSLSPEARLEWIRIVDLHSSALLRCVQAIRADLAYFAPSPQGDDAGVEAITNIKELMNAADQLLSLSRSSDRILASAFALSASPEESEVLKKPEFWRSLERLEALARETAATERTLQAQADRASR
jgi:RNA polymerase sigma factor (sigma-70 family)